MLLRDTTLISLTVILVRSAWIFPVTHLPRLLLVRIRERNPSPPRQPATIAAWVAVRRAVSLAAALALPEFTAAGAPFPARDLVMFVTVSDILTALVSQTPFSRWLGVVEDDRVRREATRAALEPSDELALEHWLSAGVAETLRGRREQVLHRVLASLDPAGTDYDHFTIPN